MTGNRTARKMFFVHFGGEHVAHELSVRGGTSTYYWEPFLGAVIETDEGWCLIDSGMSRRAFESPDVARAYRAGSAVHQTPPWPLRPVPPAGSEWAWIEQSDPLQTALARLGLLVSDLTLAAISHLHVDHSGGIPTLADHAVPVVISRRELDFARSGKAKVSDGFFAPDWEHPDTIWRVIDDETEIAPGVMAIPTPGHTPGHLSFLVRLESTGAWLLAGDAADLGQNFLEGVPCGSCAGGTESDQRSAEKSLDQLFTLARRTNARIIPGHDPLVHLAARHPEGGHR